MRLTKTSERDSFYDHYAQELEKQGKSAIPMEIGNGYALPTTAKGVSSESPVFLSGGISIHHLLPQAQVVDEMGGMGEQEEFAPQAAEPKCPSCGGTNLNASTQQTMDMTNASAICADCGTGINGDGQANDVISLQPPNQNEPMIEEAPEDMMSSIAALLPTVKMSRGSVNRASMNIVSSLINQLPMANGRRSWLLNRLASGSYDDKILMRDIRLSMEE